MARLAAIQHLGFVPTPSRVVELIAKRIRGPKAATFNANWGRYSAPYLFVDPCCGEGAALKQLASLLIPNDEQVRTLGVELDGERCAQAALVLDNAIQADAFRTILTGGEKAPAEVRYADLVWLNPPYEQVVSGAESERYELEFLAHCLPMAAEFGGICVYIVREPLLQRYQDSLSKLFHDCRVQNCDVFRFPDPEYSAYQQVAVILTRSGRSGVRRAYKFTASGILGEDLDFVHPPVFLGQNSPQSAMPDGGETVWKVLPEITAEPFVYRELEPFFGEIGGAARDFHPLGPLRDEHAILVASGGLLNGVPVGGFVVRGHSYKIQKSTERHYNDDQGRKVTEKIAYDQLVHKLTLLDHAGKIVSYNDQDQPVDWQAAMLRYGPLFLQVAQDRYGCTATPERQAKYYPVLRTVQAPKVLPGATEREVLPQQLDRAAAIMVGWERLHTVTVGGEMSVGKTLISLMAAYAYASKRRGGLNKIVVVVPATTSTVSKWVSEAKAILGPLGARAFEVRSKKDVDQAFGWPGMSVLIMPETAAKLMTGWDNLPRESLRPVRDFRWLKLSYYSGLASNHENEQLQKSGVILTPVKDGDGHYVEKETDWSRYRRYEVQLGFQCPNCGATMQPAGKGKKYCPVCKEPLWAARSAYDGPQVQTGRQAIFGPMGAPRSPLPGKPRRTAKVALAKYIRQNYARRYVLIVDEVHEYKSGASARSYAVTDLMAASSKCVQMTGTLSDGLASGLFHIMYRSDPVFRQLYRHNEVQKFVQMYGLQETVTRFFPSYVGDTFNGYKEYTGSPSEIPGTHPGMVVLMLPSSVFLALSDLAYKMPAYSEHTLFVEPSNKLLAAYNPFMQAVKGHAMQALREDKDRSLFAQWLHARYRVLDAPMLSDQIGLDAYAPPVVGEREAFPKEEAFLRLVHRERGRGRPVLCFVSQMHRGDSSPRLIGLLEQYNMRGVAMYADTDDRTGFIRQAVADGVDVIFTSAPLVRVSVDIIETPTIIWYGVEFQTVIYPQANRRPYRLTQPHPVEVYYLAYQKTVQAAAFHFIARKLTASQIFQGHAVNGLAALQGEDSFVRQLQEIIMDEDDKQYDSDLSLDDLPLLPGMTPVRVVVPVRFLPKRMHGLPGTEHGVCFECFKPFNGTVEQAKLVSIIEGGPVYRVCPTCVRDRHFLVG